MFASCVKACLRHIKHQKWYSLINIGGLSIGLAGLTAIGLVVGFVSGVYPALFLSSFEPVRILRTQPAGGAKRASCRFGSVRKKPNRFSPLSRGFGRPTRPDILLPTFLSTRNSASFPDTKRGWALSLRSAPFWPFSSPAWASWDCRPFSLNCGQRRSGSKKSWGRRFAEASA